MGKLIYSAIASLDGYVADEAGEFGWAEPDEEVHRFVNDLSRNLGTELYGRRMYEVMVAWENPDAFAGGSEHLLDFAQIWQAADKVVYSRTLKSPSTARTRIEREFDPEAVREMKVAAKRDLGIGGPELAAAAIAAGLVDEWQLFVAPVIVGGGKRWLPDRVFQRLELTDQLRFASGFAYLGYRSAT